ncbi:UNVERIFIED_CONTAM: hypothetical protein GTU68_020101 [Idotea baltica]|nr:hypothetical protein [Idotea baltica]
MLCLTPRSQ